MKVLSVVWISWAQTKQNSEFQSIFNQGFWPEKTLIFGQYAIPKLPQMLIAAIYNHEIFPRCATFVYFKIQKGLSVKIYVKDVIGIFFVKNREKLRKFVSFLFGGVKLKKFEFYFIYIFHIILSIVLRNWGKSKQNPWFYSIFHFKWFKR